MKKARLIAASIAVVLTTAVPCFAQDAAVIPGTGGTEPLTPGTGVGLDSPATGYSESGAGGTGGAGWGPTTNGTADGAGTATGGEPGGYPEGNAGG